MTTSYPERWYDPRGPVVDSPEDHPQLMAWYAEQNAERAPLPTCTCFYVDGRGKPEFTGDCDMHRDAFLAEVGSGALDDDKRETPGHVA